MAKRLDMALVIDVESTCWEACPPRGQFSEIIEVGLCLVDLRLLDRLERRCIMVKPMNFGGQRILYGLDGYHAKNGRPGGTPFRCRGYPCSRISRV